jgi:Relaxase/Mobilisation nuclease domain
MICDISLGKFFFHCISYCLEDKQKLTEEQKIKLSILEGVQHTKRAEVLTYNQCFGNKHELAEQFNDVRKLSRRVEKPVLHLSLRLAPGETLNKNQLLDIAGEMVKEMGVENNQYLVVEHKDTKEQHIHIVANRVGYDGKASSSSNNFYMMNKLCRRLEKQYKLKEVLSPRAFLPKEMRHIPRHDIRKEKMKADIKQSLAKAHDYENFASRMQALGYKIIKGRGITFIDDKKVMVKGSELGYSLMTIEKILQLKQELNVKDGSISMTYNSEHLKTAQQQRQKLSELPTEKVPTDSSIVETAINSASNQFQKGAAALLDDLMKPEETENHLNTELINQLKRKKKRKKQLHL